jgi:phospholipase A1
MHFTAPRHAALALTAGLACALSAAASARDLQTCRSVTEDAARLACYDALAGAPSAPAAASPPSAPPPTSAAAPPGEPPVATSHLEQQWELRPDLRHGVLNLYPYRPLYILAHATTRINQHPQSPTRAADVTDLSLQRAEAKLQLSFRTKLGQDMLGSGTDAWFGYTQQSYWQAANARYSSPFRETDYEPEFIVLHPLPFEALGVHARYAALSFTHQSNGRGQSLSRSWNRLIGDVAFESGEWSLHVRPWMRAFEAGGQRDDNPDILDYVGRGELVLEHRHGRDVLTLRLRHTLRGGERNRGSAQLDWAFPLAGALNGHVQVFNGFGESLIDYNHRQTTLGVGLSFAD